VRKNFNLYEDAMNQKLRGWHLWAAAAIWLVLPLPLLAAGCAAGSGERSEAYQEPYYQTQHLYKNPETQGEYEERIWEESQHSGGD
jgi:hypothetical protein